MFGLCLLIHPSNFSFSGDACSYQEMTIKTTMQSSKEYQTAHTTEAQHLIILWKKDLSSPQGWTKTCQIATELNLTKVNTCLTRSQETYITMPVCWSNCQKHAYLACRTWSCWDSENTLLPFKWPPIAAPTITPAIETQTLSILLVSYYDWVGFYCISVLSLPLRLHHQTK